MGFLSLLSLLSLLYPLSTRPQLSAPPTGTPSATPTPTDTTPLSTTPTPTTPTAASTTKPLPQKERIPKKIKTNDAQNQCACLQENKMILKLQTVLEKKNLDLPTIEVFSKDCHKKKPKYT